MRLRLALAVLFSLQSAASIASAQGTTKLSPKCDEVIVRDKSHPVWKALDSQYAKIAEAVLKKDLDTMFAPYQPDFQVKLPNGEIWNREQTLGFIRNVYSQVKDTIHTSNTILRLTVCGENEAAATVLQRWYRMQMWSGKLRRVETNNRNGFGTVAQVRDPRILQLVARFVF